MLYKFGGFFGWLIIICYTGTMLNYIMKAVNKRFGKRISQNVNGKKCMRLLMKIFVKNHKFFGFATVVFLILHFIIQFMDFGFNLMGAIVACLLILQVMLGMFGSFHHKKREGVWFILHRTIAVLLIVGIIMHVFVPNMIAATSSKNAVAQTQVSPSGTKVFTLEELAKYNGENGQPAYVAYKGTVYDVSAQPNWANGKHNGESAGTDLTNDISKSPHGDQVFDSLPVVGTLG